MAFTTFHHMFSKWQQLYNCINVLFAPIYSSIWLQHVHISAQVSNVFPIYIYLNYIPAITVRIKWIWCYFKGYLKCQSYSLDSTHVDNGLDTKILLKSLLQLYIYSHKLSEYYIYIKLAVLGLNFKVYRQRVV
jgi:hypothetical protein